MDPNPTPFPGKKQAVKSKPNRKQTHNLKTFSKETAISRQTVVFGTVRNTNILSAKPIPRRLQEWNPTTRVPIPEPTKKKRNKNKHNSSENPEPRSIVAAEEEEVIDEKTPIATVPAPATPRRSDLAASKYQSAKICSKCRLDRLETSSYWLAQIKLSDSVGKHFVSAAFFDLALESKAEPISKLRLELKRYLGRNVNLGGQREWRKVCVSYGISKDEKSTTIDKKSEIPQTTNQVSVLDQGIEAANTR